jgi:hypothetical protein
MNGFRSPSPPQEFVFRFHPNGLEKIYGQMNIPAQMIVLNNTLDLQVGRIHLHRFYPDRNGIPDKG